MTKYYTVDELRQNKELARSIRDEFSNNTWFKDIEEFWQKLGKIIKENKKILDVGCGSGFIASEMTKRYNLDRKNFYLIDIDNYLIFPENKGMNFFSSDISFSKLPFANDSFDIVLSSQVIEHLENPFNYLREIERVLKPGGYFILSLPNGWNIFSRFLFLFKGKIEGWHKDNNHITFLPRDVFWRFLKNYQVIDIVGQPRKRGWLPPFCWFDFNYPRNEFFSQKVCYYLRKK